MFEKINRWLKKSIDYHKKQILNALFKKKFLANARILTPDGRSRSLGAHPSAKLDSNSHLVNTIPNPTLNNTKNNQKAYEMNKKERKVDDCNERQK